MLLGTIIPHINQPSPERMREQQRLMAYQLAESVVAEAAAAFSNALSLDPVSVTLMDRSVNYESIKINYGPRPATA